MAQPPQTDQPRTPPPNPRAFAQASGFVFQIVGWSMIAGGCCIGPAIGALLGSSSMIYNSPGQWWHDSPANQRLIALNIILLGVAGLALAVLGLGLAQERRGSATGCVVVTGLMAVAWWACTIAAGLLDFDFSKIALLLLNVAIALGTAILFVMALTSLRVMRLHPPPPDEPVTEEFLAQLARKRHRVEEEED
jgi:hypothetical protein